MEGSDSTKLKLNQTGVPRSEEEHLTESWNVAFFDRIKSTFGYGM
jgi:activator of HSP90 ATPase